MRRLLTAVLALVTAAPYCCCAGTIASEAASTPGDPAASCCTTRIQPAPGPEEQVPSPSRDDSCSCTSQRQALEAHGATLAPAYTAAPVALPPVYPLFSSQPAADLIREQVSWDPPPPAFPLRRQALLRVFQI